MKKWKIQNECIIFIDKLSKPFEKNHFSIKSVKII